MTIPPPESPVWGYLDTSWSVHLDPASPGDVGSLIGGQVRRSGVPVGSFWCDPDGIPEVEFDSDSVEAKFSRAAAGKFPHPEPCGECEDCTSGDQLCVQAGSPVVAFMRHLIADQKGQQP